jgi:hypothetical protein
MKITPVATRIAATVFWIRFLIDRSLPKPGATTDKTTPKSNTNSDVVLPVRFASSLTR